MRNYVENTEVRTFDSSTSSTTARKRQESNDGNGGDSMSEQLTNSAYNIMEERLRRDSQKDKLLKKIHDLEESTKDFEELLIRGFVIYPEYKNVILRGTEIREVLKEFSVRKEVNVALSITLEEEGESRRTYKYEFRENLEAAGLKNLPISPNFTYSVEMVGLDMFDTTFHQHFMIGVLTIRSEKNVNKHVSEYKPNCVENRKRLLPPRQGKGRKVESFVFPFEGSRHKNEGKMLNSFKNWQLADVVSSTTLIRNGFYLNDAATKIICVECGYNIETHRLREVDARTSHRQNSPTCSQAAIGLVSSITENDCEADEEGSDQQTSRGESDNPFFNDTAAANSQQKILRRSSFSIDNSSSSMHKQSNNPNHREQETVVPRGAASNFGELYPTSYSEPHNRENTFRCWNHNKFRDTKVLSDAGFYYTGERDAVRCFSCDIGLTDWKPSDDPWVEHARHSPSCTFLKENKTQEFIDNVQQAWSQVYKPRHPRYNELSERIKSFENLGWPQDYVRQTSAELAAAGFFYTGETDTVRCHYCDGGLRDWEPEDDPWIEHGRWFSFCKFVIRKKGMPFIQECATGNRSRPAISEPYIPKNLPKSYTNQDYESVEEKWKKIERDNPMKTAAAISVKEIGYSNATVKSVINAYIARTGKRDFDASSLMQIILDWEEQGHVLSKSTYTSDEKSDSESDEFEFTPQALQKENEVMKNKLTCMGCKTRERTILLVPCGHRLMCEDCAKKQTHCCHCDTPIQRTVKTFLV